MITGYDHVTVNYDRQSVAETEHIKKINRVGFIEFLSTRLDAERFEGLCAYLLVHHFDSDALFDDVLEKEEKTERVFVDETQSNIAALFDEKEEDHFMRLKLSMLEYKNIKCTVEHVLNLADCPHIHQIIRNLKKFDEHAFAVDAGNVIEIDLSAIIKSFDHLVTVHNLFSIENRPLIREHITHRIGCAAGSECRVLQNHAQRKREGNQVQNPKFRNADASRWD